MYKPKKNEVVFDLKPIGVKYICEFCNEGEMIVDRSSDMLLSNPLISHKCTKCLKTLLLPKSYPYIEWIEVSPTIAINNNNQLIVKRR